ncbi:MAG: ComEC/Rec2 family competence protein [Alphaproteobacteria bacterium]|nr:ComEC/Rec2 family competence protein [Alphaproteobacteria bacterium]
MPIISCEETTMLEAQSLDGIAPETELAGTARRIRLWILEQIALQKDRAALWLPVLLGLGIGIYFALPEEPPLVLGLFTWVLMAAVLAAIWPYRFGKKGRKLYFGIIIMLLPLTGFAAAQIRTHKAFTPMIERKIGPVTLTGTIRSVEKLPGKKGSRVVLDGLRIEDIEPSKTPRLVRLQLRQDSDIRVGQKISALAELTPPSAPVYPGGYDFRRSFYFQGIGAVGFIYRAPEILAQPTQGLWNIEGLRQSIAGVLWRELPAEQAAIVSALTIGQQKGIPEKDEEDLRDAGLAHLLAISGMNISFVAGLIFFLTRLLLAASPVLALKFPIKKIAATLSFAGAVFYMMLSGAEVPVQRAVLMTGIVILAIIMDRTPISLRLVSFSAFVILLVSPESLISASFQMSFGAVIALVAFYEGTEQFWIRSYRDAGPLRRIALYFIGVCLSSLIASTATAPFAAYHFQQFPTYGLLANLMAVPLMGFFNNARRSGRLHSDALRSVILASSTDGAGSELDDGHRPVDGRVTRRSVEFGILAVRNLYGLRFRRTAHLPLERARKDPVHRFCCSRDIRTAPTLAAGYSGLGDGQVDRLSGRRRSDSRQFETHGKIRSGELGAAGGPARRFKHSLSKIHFLQTGNGRLSPTMRHTGVPDHGESKEYITCE